MIIDRTSHQQQMKHTITILPGDGIGPEITAATVNVLDAANQKFDLNLEWDQHTIGFSSLQDCGTTFPEKAREQAASSAGVILGPISHLDYPPAAEGGINVSAALRTGLDLYANIRPARSRPFLPCPSQSIDLVIFREATEGFYADRNMHSGPGEFMVDADTAIALRRVTSRQSERIARAAFAAATLRRKSVTAVHKANVLRVSDGLFLENVRAVAAEYPAIAYNEVLVDAAAALLIRQPEQFDCIVTTNMFGDILSDEASELAGGLGLAGSINAGDTHCVAQAQHGSAPSIANQDRANPSSLILSAAMLLDWLALKHNISAFHTAAQAINTALDQTLESPSTRTADLGGPLGTRAFAQTIAAKIT